MTPDVVRKGAEDAVEAGVGSGDGVRDRRHAQLADPLAPQRREVRRRSAGGLDPRADGADQVRTVDLPGGLGSPHEDPEGTVSGDGGLGERAELA